MNTFLMTPSVVDVWVTRLTTRIPPKLRIWLEGLAVALMGAVMAYKTLPALRDRGQSFYNDVTTNALGPDRHGMAHLLTHGIWPSWLPNAFGGEPYLANSQHGVLYPGNLPFLIFSHTGTALDVMIWGHIVLAFLGAWWVVRVVWGRGFWAGAVAAILFGLGSQVLTHTVLGDQLQGTVLAPWVIGATHLALERGKLRHIALLAVATGMQFLAGHPEMWLYTLGMSVTYGIAWAFKEPGWPRRMVQAGLRVGGGIGLFVLLFGWQLLPTLQLQKQGYRSQGFHQQYPLPVQSGVDALLPDFGKVLKGENQAFVGVLGLVLFAIALAVGGRQWRWLRGWLAIMAALGFLMALGNSDFFYKFLYDNGPLISSFRVPSRWLLLPNLAFALGAGLGVDVLLRGGKGATLVARVRERTQGLGLAIAVTAVGTAFAFLFAGSVSQQTGYDGASNHKWIAALLAGILLWLVCTVPAVPRILVAVALVVVPYKELSEARPLAEYHQRVPNVVYDDYGTNLSTISAAGGRYMSTITNSGLDGPATADQRATTPIPPGISGEAANYYKVAAPNRYFGVPNDQLATDADTILGRDGGLVPTARWKDFYTATTGAGGDIGSGRQLSPPSKLNWTSMDLLGIDWFLMGTSQPQSEKDVLISHGFTLDGADAYVDRWHRATPPRARIVHTVDVIPGEKQRVATLSDAYPLLTSAIVEQPVKVDPAGAQPDQISMGREGRTTVRLSATAQTAGLLVLADPIYPGWEVTVDGHSAKILTVDSALRGVRLPAGHHQIEFRYVDQKFRLGLGLTAVTLIGMVGWTLVNRRRARESSATP